MKKLMNSVETLLDDALHGLAAAHPQLHVDPQRRIVTRAGAPLRRKVALVSGGGSGHEPLHAGFVGVGALDAACPGEVFTSPLPEQMLEATHAVHSGAGAVFVVKNDARDVMNFDAAADLLAEDGIEVQGVLVSDDVAVDDGRGNPGRRGTGATVFIEKIAGALAERGADLLSVVEMGRRVNELTRSFAVALTAPTTPAEGRPSFDLADDEIELGVGIDGERGSARWKTAPAHEVIHAAMDEIIGLHVLNSHDDAIVMVNGLGATPLIELYIAFHEVATRLHDKGINVARSLVGTYVTSLDAAGASITVAKADEVMLSLWDAPVDTPALRWGA